MKKILLLVVLFVLPAIAFAAPKCQQRTKSAEAELRDVTVIVQCQSGEYLLTWGFQTSDDSAQLVRAQPLFKTGSAPTGIKIKTDNGFLYTLKVQAVCCR